MISMETMIGAMASLGRHKLRSFLTMLGMIFGVGAVIAMLSIGAGAEDESLKTIASFGIRNIIIQAKEFKSEELKQIDHPCLDFCTLAFRTVAGLCGVPGAG